MQPPKLRHLASAALLACATLSAQAQITTGAMTMPRLFHQASVLTDGRVLISGGTSKPGAELYATSEIYDPITGTFTPAAPLLSGRREHASVTLTDGRVLIAGGSTPTSLFSSSSEIYDPTTGQWAAGAPMNAGFYRAIARLLPDGRAMVVSKDGSGAQRAEIYDPATGMFSKSGNMVEASGWFGLVVLADGRVLKVGGYGSNGYSRNAEIWDPTTNQWTATGQMATARQDIAPALLPDGRVLVAGGHSSSQFKSTEIYDPATGTFSPGSDMPMVFSPDSATVLDKGEIVFTDPYKRELLHYSPGTGNWNIAGPKRGKSRETTVSRLQNGNLLLAGGAAENDATDYASIWDQACASQATAVTSTTQAAPANGGAVSFSVSAALGCRYDASATVDWLKQQGSNPVQSEETQLSSVSFVADPNMTGALRSSSFYLANQLVTVSQVPSSTCPWAPTVSPAVTSLPYQGGTGKATVSAPDGCYWTVAMPQFATATSATSGSGNGSFTYSVPSNYGTASRSSSGLISALDYSNAFTFTQDAAPYCPSAPTVSLSTYAFPSNGGSAIGTVKAAPTCTWTLASLPSWARLDSAASGKGDGSFAFTITNNDGVARTGPGTLNGPNVATTFNISQAAGQCSGWTISPTSTNFPASGTSGSFTVTAAAACSWSISAVPAWMTIRSGSSGSGNGTISYSVAANQGGSRNATATFSGSGPTQSISLAQAGALTGCTAPITNGVPVNGNLQYANCPDGARGMGYFINRYTFDSAPGRMVTITLSSSSFDTYLYLRDPAGNVIKFDDDSGGGTNSRISFMLPAGTAGTYTIEATSYYTGRSGPYTLTFTQ